MLENELDHTSLFNGGLQVKIFSRVNEIKYFSEVILQTYVVVSINCSLAITCINFERVSVKKCEHVPVLFEIKSFIYLNFLARSQFPLPPLLQISPLQLPLSHPPPTPPSLCLEKGRTPIAISQPCHIKLQ